jgi:hypothetical protein
LRLWHEAAHGNGVHAFEGCCMAWYVNAPARIFEFC